MKTLKETYEKPYSKSIECEFQGIVCATNLESIEPGYEHDWEPLM